MLEPATPHDEVNRLAALRDLGMLDTPPEERFDRLTRLTRHSLDMPIVLISLVDSQRQWFKSCQGLVVRETPRNISFCGHTILSDQLFIVPDALLDPRFADNPLVVNAPNIRFYAGQPLHARDGSLLGTLCVIDDKPRDLSETQRDDLRVLADMVENEFNAPDVEKVAAAMQSSKNRLAAILDNVLDGIITINEAGIVDSFNKSAEKIFGYTANEVIGRNISMLMPEPYCSEHDGYLNNFLTTGKAKVIGVGRQVTGRRRDGSIFPMDLAVSAMQLGEQRLFTGIVRDITDRVKIERMKSEFISTVSHELRTPLTSIRGSLGLIAGGVAGELPAQAKVLLDIAHKNSERLILLVNDILDMEKIEAGKMEFQAKPVALKQLVQQAMEDNLAYAEQCKVSYEVEGELSDATINVDANRLLQVLANLFSNAAKFSPPGDKVRISVCSDGNRARISVSDHGCGIPLQFRSKIFQKFAQADSSDTRKKGGTGLGLSITKAIVEQMGGTIDFDSEPGVLTTFFIEFPLSSVCEKPLALSYETGKKRVLICEDDRDIAYLLKLMLEQMGLLTDIAYDAEQAKVMLAQHEYAAMTLDLGLPGKSGIVLIRELRAAKETAELPIVVVSANASEGRAELQSESFCVIDWISKPISRDQLVVAMQQAIAQVKRERPLVLHVEDDPDIYHVVQSIVGEFAQIEHADSLSVAKQMLHNKHYDLAILDITLPDGSGMELLHLLNTGVPPVPVVIFSAHEMGQESVRQVREVLVKSRTDNAQLLNTIKRLVGIDQTPLS